MPVYVLPILILGAIALEIPVVFAFIFGCATFLIFDGSYPLSVIVSRIGPGLDSFPLLALPLFIFAGNLMNSAGIARRIFNFANSMVGHIPGGLGHVNVLASIIFAGMSGVAQADAAGLGKIEIQEMRRAGYSEPFSVAITAVSAIIGPIIPPSGIMVIYAVLAGVALDKLFLAGFIPGLLLGTFLMITISFLVKTGKVKAPLLPYMSWGKRGKAFIEAAPALMIPGFLIFGLLSGIATPTELGALTVTAAIILGFLQRELSFQDLFHCAAETAKTLGVLAILIACAAPFTWIMGINNVGQGLENFFLGISQNKYVFLLVITAALLLAGSIMETTVILLIVVPIISPLIAIYGIDPVHFGIIVILNLLLGTLTPPFGVLLFVMMDLTGISIYKLLRAIMPFYIPILLLLLIITLTPAITTFIPNLVGR